MTKPTYKNIHNRFRLNGVHYTFDELSEVGYSYVKEGTAYERTIGEFFLDWAHPSSELTLQTSGSTGKPKKMVFSKQSLVDSALATGNFFNLKVGDRALHCLSSDYIAGRMMLVRAMILGLEIDLVPPEGNPLKHNNKNYEFVAMVPLQVEKALSEIERIGLLIVGGASLATPLKKALAKKKVLSYETYGMTETLTHIAARKIDESDQPFSVLPGVEIESNAQGCLVIRCAHLDQKEIVTNDCVEITSPTHFQLKGRRDNIINSGGIKILPENVEKQLSTLIVNPFFVIGIPDEQLGQKAILLIEGQRGKTLTEAIEQFKMEAYQKPKAIYFLPRFRYTATGKIQRKATLALLNL